MAAQRHAGAGQMPPAAPDTVPRLQGITADDEITLWGPDPWVRTRARMAGAQSQLYRYCESHGRYPLQLAEALPQHRSDWAAEYEFDAWNRPLVYSGRAANYELRSAGSDGHLNSADDIVGTAKVWIVAGEPTATIEQVNPCLGARDSAVLRQPATTRSTAADSAPPYGGIADTEQMIFPYPIDRTSARMATLRLRIAAYLAEHGSIPVTIDDFFPPASRGFWEADFDRDAWNHPFRYTPKGSDYELRSAGADGVFDTRDDIVVSRMIGTRWG